jgi:CTP synthase
MQMAIIEFARNVLNLKKATSTEFNKNGLPVIGLINEWNKDGKVIKGTDKELGGTMRLGSYEAKLKENSMIKKIYGKKMIEERHRHRYEVNINFRDRFEKKGMIFSGLSPDDTLPEIIELKNHPWFIGVQFHPEFKSRPLSPHPLFSSFIKASKNYK